jgi:hypothetical protein
MAAEQFRILTTMIVISVMYHILVVAVLLAAPAVVAVALLGTQVTAEMVAQHQAQQDYLPPTQVQPPAVGQIKAVVVSDFTV